MNGIALAAIFVGNLTLTSYRSVPSQTKPKDCEWTSIGDRVCRDGVAVSQDLLESGRVRYGDWIYIEGVGLKRINDTMNRRHREHVDVWVRTLDEERAFHSRFRGRRARVWLINLRPEGR